MSETFFDEISQEKIRSVLKNRHRLDLENSKSLANAILRMSNFYIDNPHSQTPWKESWCQIAQLSYYLPLNVLRLERVFREAHRLGFFRSIRTVVDFGSGLGASQIAMQNLAKLDSSLRIPFSVIEASRTALDLSSDLGLQFQIQNNLAKAEANSLLICSYSLTELKDSHFDWIQSFDHLILIEPSTRQDGRPLLELRQKLINTGFELWAPCTHQQACPLLDKHPHDWCHDRIVIKRPEWLVQVEDLLPFQNKSITHSYLVASRRPRPPTSANIRTVGDLMREKGKARQMICRGPEREFFAWLERNHEPQVIPRGQLCEMPKEFDIKSNELRPKTQVPWKP